ncbi:MAG: cupin domain-containing protein [Actinobacteria bacterium]|nr:cupin domain-containing protein [Actinomycetota bacterium]
MRRPRRTSAWPSRRQRVRAIVRSSQTSGTGPRQEGPMSETRSTKIRVIKPEDVIWEEALTGGDETQAPGREFTAAQSADDRFSFGLWRRDAQSRHFERSYHEIAYIIEGEVEITDDDGEVLTAGPGDILITPQGSRGYWRNLSPVKKVWGIYEEVGADLESYIGPGAF